MNTKELHNQTLITSLETNHRFAVGYPGQEGADNIFVTNLLKLFLKYGSSINVTAGSNTITLDSAFSDANYAIFIRTTSGSGYEITTQAAGSFDINFLESDTIDYLCLKI